jgi:hypothetical protein
MCPIEFLWYPAYRYGPERAKKREHLFMERLQGFVADRILSSYLTNHQLTVHVDGNVILGVVLQAVLQRRDQRAILRLVIGAGAQSPHDLVGTTMAAEDSDPNTHSVV